MSDTLFPQQPSLTTERLILRPMVIEDGPTIYRLVNDKDIAYDCVNIPYPYPEGAAESWISTHAFRFMQQQAVIYAITKKEGDIVGACGLEFKFEDQRYDIGYWIGKEFWRNGYASEAAQALLDYGLNVLEIPLIGAECLATNVVSYRVLEKIGMKHVARIRKPCHSPTKEEDVEVFHAEKNAK